MNLRNHSALLAYLAISGGQIPSAPQSNLHLADPNRPVPRSPHATDNIRGLLKALR